MKYEILIEDSFYHIYNRGNNRENLFLEEENYFYFLKLLQKHTKDTCFVLSYCLLKNHFHLLIKTKENLSPKQISQSFSNLFNAYSKAINKRFNRVGSLFQYKFSRIKIEDENYVKNLLIYIHLNPVHHGFLEDFTQYKYSSYQSYLSDKKTNLHRDYILNLFGGKENFIFTHKNKNLIILENLTLE